MNEMAERWLAFAREDLQVADAVIGGSDSSGDGANIEGDAS